MQDALGDRMKDYENRFRYKLPKRAYTLCRLDGKCFSHYTKGFDRPFDADLIFTMNNTAKELCENIQGAQLAYVQSDEITILLTDFKKQGTCAYFDGNIQKICSITASMAGVFFNKYMNFTGKKGIEDRYAFFDSRCWSLADPFEVENCLLWRQKDAVRNSIQLVAQSLYSHKELHGKKQDDLQEMIFQKGKNWNNFPVSQRRGRVVVKTNYEIEVDGKKVSRSRWEIQDPPIFTKDRSFLRELIPTLPSWEDIVVLEEKILLSGNLKKTV